MDEVALNLLACGVLGATAILAIGIAASTELGSRIVLAAVAAILGVSWTLALVWAVDRVVLPWF